LCMRQGFTARDAFEAYELVSECALGAAIHEIRTARSSREGLPPDLWARSLLAQGGSLPHLARLLEDGPWDGRVPFRRQLAMVLAGIAALRGQPWAQIQALLPGADAS
jgi:hypothetical protein